MGAKVKLFRSRGSSKNDAVTFDPDKIAPIQGSFDLSGDAFGKAERVRRGLTAVSLLATTVLTGLVLLGAYFGVQAERDATAAEQASARTDQLNAELRQLDQAEGIPASDLRSHNIERQSVVKEALADEIDTVAVARQVVALANSAGVDIREISFSVDQSEPAEQPTGGEGGSEESSVATEPAQVVTSMQVVAVGPASAVPLFVDSVSSITGVIAESNPSFSTTDSVTELTLSADLTEELASSRAIEVAAQSADGLTPAQEDQISAGETVAVTEQQSAPSATDGVLPGQDSNTETTATTGQEQ